ADVAGHVHVEESPLARAQVARDLYELTGEKWPPLPVDEKDRAQLWQSVDDPLYPFVQARLLFADLLVRHAADDLVDLRDRALDRLKHLERVLVQAVEGALDAVGGDRLLMAVVLPARHGSQHERKRAGSNRPERKQ